jgi:hypothetical protein
MLREIVGFENRKSLPDSDESHSVKMLPARELADGRVQQFAGRQNYIQFFRWGADNDTG